MTDTPNDPIVVARSTQTGRLSASVPFSELFKLVQEQIGLDKVYALLPGGSGFSLKELGTLSLAFTPFHEEPAPTPSPALPQYVEETQYIDPTALNAPGREIAPRTAQPSAPRRKRAPRGKERPLTATPEKETTSQPATSSPSLAGPSPVPPGRGAVETVGFIPASREASDDCDLYGKIHGY